MLFYLAADALCLGLMATALCMSFFPSGLIRIALLTLLFPLLSLALCAWMTVFGFYLRLEDIARRAQKRKMDKMALEKSSANQNWIEKQQHQQINKTNSISEFINLAFEEEAIT